MLDKLQSHVNKHPLAWICVSAGAVVMGVVLTRKSDRQTRYLSSADQVLKEQMHKQADNLRNAGASLAEDGAKGAKQLKRGVGQAVSSLESGLSAPRQRGLMSSISNHEKAIAAFSATLLAKGVSSYFQWRDMARARNKASPARVRHEPTIDNTDLEQMTVAELRKHAARREIAGRSGMKKDELVDALKN